MTLVEKGSNFFFFYLLYVQIAGWSSMVARRAHNPEVVGSNPTPATNLQMKKDTNNEIIQIFFNRSFNTANHEL